jgi:ribulose 1,5-bisphosphate synthetase/thiazole synthase
MNHRRTSKKTTRREFLSAAGTLMAGGATLAATGSTGPGQDASAPPIKSRRPTLAEVDVLVVGGGPAGIGAAIGAARKGAKTLLIENHSFFGGVAAWCLGMPINQVRPGGKPRSAIHELLIEKLVALGKQAVRVGQHELFCNVDYLKVAAVDALEAAGCRYLVCLRAVDTLVESNRVTGVVIATKNGLADIRAKAVVDCTGDADVAFFAGAETLKETGDLAPMTLCLNLTNVSRAELLKANMREVISQARAKYPLIPEAWGLSSVGNSQSCYFINHPGTKNLGQFDATDPDQRTKAECLSRRQAVQMTQAMREFGGEALQNIELIGTGPQLGVRETRRVKGAYVLTEDDAKAGRKFDDAIAWRSGFLDIGFVRFERMKIHDVPYRSVLPEKLDGLLMAGRCISATHQAAAAGKSMGNCMATGHATGLAAALCAKKGIMPREIKVNELQDALRVDGVSFDVTDRDQAGLRG